jgi:hypothetical protein
MPSPALLAISSALLTASAEMILTPAPSILSSSLGSRGLSYYLVLSPLVPRWLLILICLVLLCFLTHRDAKASLWSSRDFHLPQRDLGISMGSWVAVEPSGTGSHLCLEPRSPSGQRPHTGLRSRVLQRSSHPEVSSHQDLAEISPHHQNNYGLDAYKLKPTINMSTTNNNESRNSLPSPASRGNNDHWLASYRDNGCV